MIKYLPIIIFSAIVVTNYASLIRGEFSVSAEELPEYETVAVVETVEEETATITTSTIEYVTKVLGLFFDANEAEQEQTLVLADAEVPKESEEENISPNEEELVEEVVISESLPAIPVAVEPEEAPELIIAPEPTAAVEEQLSIPEEEIVNDTEEQNQEILNEENKDGEEGIEDKPEQADETSTEAVEEEPPFTDEDVENYALFKTSIEDLFKRRDGFEEAGKKARSPLTNGLYGVARNLYDTCAQGATASENVADELPFVNALAFTEQYRVAWLQYLSKKKAYCEGFYNVAADLANGESYENAKSWYIEPLDKSAKAIQDSWYSLLYWDGEVKKQATERGL